MNSQTQFQDRVGGVPSWQPQAPRRKEHLYSEDFEARLQDLDDRLQDVNGDSCLVLLKGGVHVFDAVLDLRVKVEAVRWMLRAAKHLKDPARATVFSTVSNSLDQLERTIESEVDAELGQCSVGI